MRFSLLFSEYPFSTDQASKLENSANSALIVYGRSPRCPRSIAASRDLMLFQMLYSRVVDWPCIVPTSARRAAWRHPHDTVRPRRRRLPLNTLVLPQAHLQDHNAEPFDVLPALPTTTRDPKTSPVIWINVSRAIPPNLMGHVKNIKYKSLSHP